MGVDRGCPGKWAFAECGACRVPAGAATGCAVVSVPLVCSGPRDRWRGVVCSFSCLGEALPVAWLFLSLKVSGLDFLDFGPARTGSGAPPAGAPCVAAPQCINSDSPLLSVRWGPLLWHLLLLFISHTLVMLPLSYRVRKLKVSS